MYCRLRGRRGWPSGRRCLTVATAASEDDEGFSALGLADFKEAEIGVTGRLMPETVQNSGKLSGRRENGMRGSFERKPFPWPAARRPYFLEPGEAGVWSTLFAMGDGGISVISARPRARMTFADLEREECIGGNRHPDALVGFDGKIVTRGRGAGLRRWRDGGIRLS